VVVAPELSSLDPHPQLHGAQATLCNAYESLTAFDARLGVVPALAARWDNPDENTWRFDLRKGVHFHDGRPLQAADVAASLERARRSGGEMASYLTMIAEVRAVSRDVVEIRTSRPYPMLLNNLAAVFITPQASAADGRPAPGTGPYRIGGFDPRAFLELHAYDDYWGGAPAIRRVRFEFEADPEARARRLAAGTADVALRLPEALAAPRSGYRLESQLAPGVRTLGLRCDRKPFSDRTLRLAVDLAIDREATTRGLLAGRSQPMGQLLPPGVFGHVPDLGPTPRDLLRARELVARASAGRGVAFELAHGAGRRAEAELLAGQLAEAGFRVTLRAIDAASLLTAFQGGQGDALLMSYLYYTGDATDVLENILHSRDAGGLGLQNLYGYRNEQVDALVERAGLTGVLSERQAAFEEATRLAMRDLPLVPLWGVPWVSGVADGVEWTPAPNGWFLAKDVRWR
jgi:peptide/nickel transport system substrate-binding protein